ncbi:MAG: Mur ligase [Lysobacteraceae bacterium]|nr:MAG: Mur ligase [Xanthomonadaceae bacterium]
MTDGSVWSSLRSDSDPDRPIAELVDSRRLTGPNVIQLRPGAVIDVSVASADVDAFIRRWSTHTQMMLDALAWAEQAITTRRVVGGVSMAISAPIDVLYAATEINEWAFQATVSGASVQAFEQEVARLRALAAEEANAATMAIADAAARAGVCCLTDDDELSVGLGRGSKTFSIEALPDPDQIDWAALYDIPVALVTGVNGKTTTVRLSTHIAMQAGHNIGVSSTDAIAVNKQVLDRGDYSGPGGARAVLRQPGVDLAILETARGGLLRRGLGINQANVALITNIAEDHLGDFGSSTVEELLAIKWIVATVVADQGELVLNADDPMLVQRAKDHKGTIVWFGTSNTQLIDRHVADGGKAATLRDDSLVWFDGKHWSTLCDIASIPLTLGGAAKHNIANALAATALTGCLGVSVEMIRQGLQTMAPNDNPGRCNLFTVSDTTVLVDFAHNPDGLRALVPVARSLGKQKRFLCCGQAGDRTDEEIRALAKAGWDLEPDAVFVSELADYRRGRGPSEVFALIRDEMLNHGAVDSQIIHVDDEHQALDRALENAQPGDLVIMLALAEARSIIERLNAATD